MEPRWCPAAPCRRDSRPGFVWLDHQPVHKEGHLVTVNIGKEPPHPDRMYVDLPPSKSRKTRFTSRLVELPSQKSSESGTSSPSILSFINGSRKSSSVEIPRPTRQRTRGAIGSILSLFTCCFNPNSTKKAVEEPTCDQRRICK
ncbi:hypothetical protein Y032_0129g1512 [Ancylostoma ceylanicum]|uniref:Uncharacterized protein n=1 Tax=Ancylostoma ceylanicum TaxID=53326 RepID=A0A016T7Q6_9BILA|nr:hypothetical protein Y032_0129g1512 [Ancylostoma ceylanicum]